jgi:hypothetical protein
LSEEEKGNYLRTLLTPLQRFQQIFLAGQVNATDFNDMNDELQAAIASIAKNKAYGETSARQSKAQHLENETDHANAAQLNSSSTSTNLTTPYNQQESNKRYRTWKYQNKTHKEREDYRRNDRYRSPTPGPQRGYNDRYRSHSNSRDRNFKSTQSNYRRSSSHDRNFRRSPSNDSHRSDDSRYNGRRSPNRWRDPNHNRYNDQYHHSRYDNRRYDRNHSSHNSNSYNQSSMSQAHSAQSFQPLSNIPTQTYTLVPTYLNHNHNLSTSSSQIQSPTSAPALSASTSAMFSEYTNEK